MGLTGSAADGILELHFVRLTVFAGPASVIFVLRLPGLWSRSADITGSSMVFAEPAQRLNFRTADCQ